MDIFTVATIGLTGTSGIGAAVSLACALRLRSNALKAERLLIASQAETKREKDGTEHLQRVLDDYEQQVAMDTAAVDRRFIATLAELSEVRAKLNAIKAANSDRTRRGNLTRTANRKALVAATTAKLVACVEQRA